MFACGLQDYGIISEANATQILFHAFSLKSLVSCEEPCLLCEHRTLHL